MRSHVFPLFPSCTSNTRVADVIDAISDGSQPAEWYHDIFRKDFTPYRKAETDIVRKLNAEKIKITKYAIK